LDREKGGNPLRTSRGWNDGLDFVGKPVGVIPSVAVF
jgi:hypothetical protein